MPDVVQEEQAFVASFRELERTLGNSEPAWLRRSREEAIGHFESLGFPSTQQEAWKYTNVAPLARIAFQPGPEASIDSQELEPALWPGACHLVFVNGKFSEALSNPGQLPAGATVKPLAEAVNQDAGVEEHLARYADPASHPFVALNTASWRDGAFVQIAKGTVVDEPIQVLFVSTTDASPTVSHPRILIVAGPGTQAKVIESYWGVGEGIHFSNAVTEIVAAENAVLDHYKVQIENQKSFHLGTVRVEQERGSNVSSTLIAFGGQIARSETTVRLGAEGAECTLNGLYQAAGTQHIDNVTTIDHAKPHGLSQQFYKGILDGRATAAFNGRIVVRKDAQKTNALQQNKNLLLSEDAVVNTTPQLEILADDVRCTHGATIGQIDREALFYLQSRGIGQKEARGLLTYAFAADVLDRIRVAPLRELLESILHTRLAEGSSV